MTLTAQAISAALGVLNHVYFHRNRPTTILSPSVVLLIQPPLVFFMYWSESTTGSSLVALWKLYASFLVSLATSIVLYRVSSFHDLAHVPGPMLYKTSKLWWIWVVYSGKQHIVLRSLHDRYGSFVRIGPNEVSMTDADAVPTILGANGLSKGDYYVARSDPTAPANLIALRGDAHNHRRRFWNRGMSTDALSEYHLAIARRATQLVDHLSRETQQSVAVDIVKWLNSYTADIMGDMAFGGGFEMMANGDTEGLWEAMHVFAVWIAIACQIPWAYGFIRKFPFIQSRLGTLRAIGIRCATQRINAGSTKKDLWYYLTNDSELEKETPSVQDAAADGTLAVVAGADTTSSALASLFYYMLQSEDLYRRLQAEVDTVYPKGENPLSIQKHADLPLLAASINEVLRLSPPVPSGGPRQLPWDSAPKLVAGHAIPPGTQIYLPQYARCRRADYFPNPDEFSPERWLPPRVSENHVQAFAPFSYGPANCVGKTLAKQEMIMTMSVLLHRFEITVAPEFDLHGWMDGIGDYFVSDRTPLVVQLKPRL